LVAACFTVISASGAAAQGDPIKVGLMGPITGSWTEEGQGMLNVVNIMVDEINAAGGIKGRKIELVVADDGGTPKTAALAAQRLVTQGVVAVVGTYGSNVTEASQDIFYEAELVQIATGSTAVRLSEKDFPLFFRTCPRDDDQGRVLAQHIKDLGFKRAAVVHDNTSYSKGLADETKALFPGLGVTEVFFDGIVPTDQDFMTTLIKIQAASPDVLVFTGYYPQAGMILRQKMEMNWNIPMIGGDATNNLALVENAGLAAADGYYFVSPLGATDIKTPKAEKLLKAYLEKYDAYPYSIWGILAGDAFGVIAKAIEEVGPDSKKIGEYLHNGLKDYEGLTGSITFNEKGDRLGEVYRLYKVNAAGEFILQDGSSSAADPPAAGLAAASDEKPAPPTLQKPVLDSAKSE
jgi:branched-chain amino acid transport system substrate-binding protein